MSKILDQIRLRRRELGYTQAEMRLRVGMSRQQYQRLESKGNPRLDNLELVAKGLKMELMLIPQEKLQAVKDVLEGRAPAPAATSASGKPASEETTLADNPWQDLLADDT